MAEIARYPRQHNRRHRGITSLRKRNKPGAAASTVKSIKDSQLCAYTCKQLLLNSYVYAMHVETRCWEMEFHALPKMST